MIDKLYKAALSIYRTAYAGWFQVTPDPNTIDRTGMIYSDHPTVGAGWIKGWVVESPNRNVAIVSRHTGPGVRPPHDTIYAINKFGKKVERRIVAVSRLNFAVGDDEVQSRDRMYGDISIIRVDLPFPSTVAEYSFATHVRDNPTTIVPLPGGEFSRATLVPDDPRAWLFASHRAPLLRAGDSGLPWFVWERGKWRVASHTFADGSGAGPWYAHPDIFEELKRGIYRLQS